MTGRIMSARAGSVARITISNPARKNALDARMWARLADEVRRADEDASVRVIQIQGDGGDFSTGVDLVAAWSDGERVNPSALTPAAETAIMRARKPTVAVVRGMCIGGGAMIACACDFRIMSASATLTITPAKFGVIYPASSVRRLTDLIGPSVAKRLLMAAETMTAAEAQRAGLADHVHSDDDLEAAADEFAAALARLAPISQAAAKEFIDRSGPADESLADATERWERIAGEDPEQRERVVGFLTRRRGRTETKASSHVR